ncbi:MAG: hypothetical protein AB7O97_05380 [Planctomycetota bacterium]
MATPSLRTAVALVLAGILPPGLQAQQPRLTLSPRAISQLVPTASVGWFLNGRAGDAYLLVADADPGPTTLFGLQFDLGLSPAALVLAAGQLDALGFGNGAFSFASNGLPAGVPVFLQAGLFRPSFGLGSQMASNGDSLVAHGGQADITFDFDNPAGEFGGVFDRAVRSRLQALPPSTRRVRPLPQEATPVLVRNELQSLHPSGARMQMVFRAADLGASGVPEWLMGILWTPLFGAVVDESFAQFEMLAAHTGVVPDYEIDPWSMLPLDPQSGLSTTFAQNAITPPVVLHQGPYDVRVMDLPPDNRLAFPVQPVFEYDGQSSLMIETRCSPTATLGAPQNQQLLALVVPTSPLPAASVAAIAGQNGQPSPLQPAAAAVGQSNSILPDWELVFRRTASVATSGWRLGSGTDYMPPVLAANAPPGTSIDLEFRGAIDAFGSNATAWSTSQDVADGLPFLQVRIRLEADPVSGAVPWIDTLIVPTA